jgi:outer membrane beta-barrel protein
MKYPMSPVMMILLYVLTPASSIAAPEPEEADVSKITEKYWAQGKDSELGVVQNRKYSNANRFELSLLAGSVSTDPFLSVASYGGSLAYSFSEYLGVKAIAWRSVVKDSDAYLSFKAQTTHAEIDRNPPKGFYGLEVDDNILYGKASLFGKVIIYVDLFALGGLGVTSTGTGDNFTAFVGIGQKIHLGQHLAFLLDYRIMRFSETLTGTSGEHQRTNTTDALTFGLGFQY